MRTAFPLLLILILPWAQACTPLPDIPPPANTGAAAPALLPLDGLLAGIATAQATDASATALTARAARLRVRAGLMRGPVLDAETRARLAQAMARGDG